MTTSIDLPDVATVDHFVLDDVSWELYEMLLNETADRRIGMTYDDGRLEFMPPLPVHERFKTLLGRFVEILTLELNIPLVSGGSTTFKRQDLKKGLEPDECYYIQHEANVRHSYDADLLKEPPPDLVIEVDYKHRVIDRERIYAALGVPEIWRCKMKGVEFAHLVEGEYQTRERSLAFPFLKRDDVQRFLDLRKMLDENSVVRQFRDWILLTAKK